MIPVAAGVRIWIASGHTDMRKGMNGLALLVQEGLGRDPFAGDVFVFRGRAGSLIKALWHDGIGLSLYAKRLDRGRFVWPATVDGVVALSAAQMSYRWKRSTGEIRNIPGDRRARARLKKSSGVQKKKSPQIADFVIPSAS
jgi:transposase